MYNRKLWSTSSSYTVQSPFQVLATTFRGAREVGMQDTYCSLMKLNKTVMHFRLNSPHGQGRLSGLKLTRFPWLNLTAQSGGTISSEMAALPASSEYSSGIAFMILIGLVIQLIEGFVHLSQQNSSEYYNFKLELNGYVPFGPYIFNLVIGTGILALPSVLISGGWLLGGIFIVLVSALSYVTLTFMLESMATTNALIRLERRKSLGEKAFTESSHLLTHVESNLEKDPYEITEKTELGQMANLYYNRLGLIVFFSVLILYLFGDGVIYSTIVVRSLLSVIYGQDVPHWGFDFFLFIFFMIMLPFCFFDFQKTKFLQVITMVIRNVCLLSIIILAFREALRGKHNVRKVQVFDIRALPNLFGGAVYSFMCHHSLPSIITPIKDKSHLIKLTSTAFALVLMIYILLFVTCLFAFGMNVVDPITFNFPPQTYGYIGDALVLFPVFTLSSTYPMILITLRNNLDNLFQLIYKSRVTPRRVREQEPEIRKEWALQRRTILTLVAVVPPTLCAFLAEHLGLSVDELVGFTGAFAGCVIMFIIPATLVYFSRRVLKDTINSTHGPFKSFPEVNKHASPFSGDKWVYAVLLWASMSMIFSAFEKFRNWYKQ